MGREIERKFLVVGDAWRGLGDGKAYAQGYINTARPDRATVRIRIAGDRGFITLKGKSEGCERDEFEYPIPVADARAMLASLCDSPLVEKTRYKIPAGDGLTWEVDEFAGDNVGLIVAEIELPHSDRAIDLPDWIGEEVTGDLRYYNVNLAKNPYKTWRLN